MVTLAQLHMRVVTVGDARQGRPNLALAAGAEVEDLVVREVLGFLVVDEVGHALEQPDRLGRRRHAVHRAAGEADTAVGGLGRADHAVHARDVRRETGDRDLALERLDQLGQGRADIGLGPGLPFYEDVGAVADHRQHALVAETAYGVFIGHTAEQRVRIDLPVACVQHDAQRRADRQAVGLGNRVGQGDQFEIERAEREGPAQWHLRDVDLVEDAGIAQLFSQQKGRERRCEHRRLEPRPQPGDRADMVLMGMGQHDAQDVLGDALGEFGIRQNDLDARGRLVAEGDPQVDDDPLAGIRRTEAVEVEIHADLVRPAERQEDELITLRGGHQAGLATLRRWISSRPRIVRSGSKWSIMSVAPSNRETTPPVATTVRCPPRSALIRAISPSMSPM